MAILMSKNQLDNARKNYYGKFYVTKKNLNFVDKVINKILISIYLFKYMLVNTKRKFFRSISISSSKKSIQKSINFSINLDEKAIKKISNELNLNNYTFIENFLSEESYKYLINSWPNINHFDHHKTIIKHFSSGFRHNSESSLNKTFSNFRDNFVLRKFYEFLLSNEFKNFYNKLIIFEKNSYELSAISSKIAPNNSYLIPHMDGVLKNKETKQHYNFILFLDGFEENPVLGGATGFYSDNEFKNPIFIPHTIRNSLVIYNQSQDFYHGFKTIECPKDIIRKSVGFQIKPIINPSN